MSETMGDKCVVCGEADEGKPLYKKLGSGEYNVEVIVALRDLQLTSLPESAKADHYICWDCDETILQEYGRYLEYEEKSKAQNQKIKEEKRIKRNEQRRKKRQEERQEVVKEKVKKPPPVRIVRVPPPSDTTSNDSSKAKQPSDVQKVNDIQHSTYCLMCDSTFDSANGGYYRYSLKKMVNDDMDVASVMEFLGLARRIAPEMKTKRFICNNCFYTIRRNYKNKLLKGTSIETPSVAKVNSKTTTPIHRATPDEHAAEIAKLLPPALAECYKIMTSDSVGNVPEDNPNEIENDGKAHSNTVVSTKHHGADAEGEEDDLNVSQDEHGNYVVDMKVDSPSKFGSKTQNDNGDSLVDKPAKPPLPSRKKKKNIMLPKRHHRHLMANNNSSTLNNLGLIPEGENNSKGGSDGKTDDASKLDEAADSRTCNICGRSFAGKEDSWWHNLSSPLTGFESISISMALQLLETSLANTTEKARLACQVCYPCYGMVSTGFRIQVVQRIARQKKIDSSKVNLSKVKVRMVRKEDLSGKGDKSAKGKSKPKNDLGGEGINSRTKDGRKKGLKRKNDDDEVMGLKKQQKVAGEVNAVMESPYDPNHVRHLSNNTTNNNKIPGGGVVEFSSDSDDFSTDEDDFVMSDGSEVAAGSSDPSYDLSSDSGEESSGSGKKALNKKAQSSSCKSKSLLNNTTKETGTVKSPHQPHGSGVKSVSLRGVGPVPVQPANVKGVVSPRYKAAVPVQPANIKKGVVSPHGKDAVPVQPANVKKGVVSPRGKVPVQPPSIKKGVVSPRGKDAVPVQPPRFRKGVVSPRDKDAVPLQPPNIKKGNALVNRVNRGKGITSDRSRKDIPDIVSVKEVLVVNSGKDCCVDGDAKAGRDDISPYNGASACYSVNDKCQYYFALSKMREAKVELRDIRDILPKEAFDGKSLSVRTLPGSVYHISAISSKDLPGSALQYLLNSMVPPNWPSNIPTTRRVNPEKKVDKRSFNGCCVVCAAIFYRPSKFWHNLRENINPPSLQVPVRWVLASLGISPVALPVRDREEGRVCEPCFDRLTKQFNEFVSIKIGESCSVKADEVNISEYIVTFNQETMNIEADPVDMTPEEEMDEAERIMRKIMPVVKSFNMDSLLDESHVYPLEEKEYTIMLLLILNEFRIQLGASIEHLVGWLCQLMPVELRIKALHPCGKKLMQLVNNIASEWESVNSNCFDKFNVPLPDDVFMSKRVSSKSFEKPTQHIEIKNEVKEEEDNPKNLEHELQWEDFLNPVNVDDLFAGKGKPLDRKDFNNGLLYALWKVTTTIGVSEDVLAGWLRQISPIPLAESHIKLLLNAPKPINEHLQQHPEDLSKLTCVIIPESAMPTASPSKSLVSQSKSTVTGSSKRQGSKAKTIGTVGNIATNPGSKVGLKSPSKEGDKLGSTSERKEQAGGGKRKRASNTNVLKGLEAKKHKSDISFSKSSPSSDAVKENLDDTIEDKRNEIRDCKLGLTGQKGTMGRPTEQKQNRQTSAGQKSVMQSPAGPKEQRQTATLLQGGGQTTTRQEETFQSPTGRKFAAKKVPRRVSTEVTVEKVPSKKGTPVTGRSLRTVPSKKGTPVTGRSLQISAPMSSVSSQEPPSMPGSSQNKKSSPLNRKINTVSICKSKTVVQTSQERRKRRSIGDSNQTANAKDSIKDKVTVHGDRVCESNVDDLASGDTKEAVLLASKIKELEEQLQAVQRKNKELVEMNQKLAVVTSTNECGESTEMSDEKGTSFDKTNVMNYVSKNVIPFKSCSKKVLKVSKSAKWKGLAKKDWKEVLSQKRLERLQFVKERKNRSKLSKVDVDDDVSKDSQLVVSKNFEDSKGDIVPQSFEGSKGDIVPQKSTLGSESSISKGLATQFKVSDSLWDTCQREKKIKINRKFKGGKHVKGRRKVILSGTLEVKNSEKVEMKESFKRQIKLEQVKEVDRVKSELKNVVSERLETVKEKDSAEERISRELEPVKDKEPGIEEKDIYRELETVKGDDPGEERRDAVSRKLKTINKKDPSEENVSLVGKESKSANVNKGADMRDEGNNSNEPNAALDTCMESKESEKVPHNPEQQTSVKKAQSENETPFSSEPCDKEGQSSQDSKTIIKKINASSVLETSEEKRTPAPDIGTEFENEDVSLSAKKEVVKSDLTSKLELEGKKGSSAMSVSAEVEKEAVVSGSTEVEKEAVSSVREEVEKEAVASGSTEVEKETVVSMNTEIEKEAVVSGSTEVEKETVLSVSAKVEKEAVASRSAEVEKEALASGSTEVGKEAIVSRNTEVEKEVVASGSTEVEKETVLSVSAEVEKEAMVSVSTESEKETVASVNTEVGKETVSSVSAEVEKEATMSGSIEVEKEAVAALNTEVKKEAVATLNTEVEKEAVATVNTEVKKEAVVSVNTEVEKEAVVIVNTEVEKEALASVITEGEKEDFASNVVTKCKEVHSSLEVEVNCCSSSVDINVKKGISTPSPPNVEERKCTSESDFNSNVNVCVEKGSSSSVDGDANRSISSPTTTDMQVEEETSSSSDSMTEERVIVIADSKKKCKDICVTSNFIVEKDGYAAEERTEIKDTSDSETKVGRSVQSCDSTKNESRLMQSCDSSKNELTLVQSYDSSKDELRSVQSCDNTKNELRLVQSCDSTKKELRSSTKKEEEISDVTKKSLRSDKKQDGKGNSGPSCQKLKEGNRNNSVSKRRLSLDERVDVNIKEKNTGDVSRITEKNTIDVSRKTETRKDSLTSDTKVEKGISDAASCRRSGRAKGNSENVGKVKTKPKPRFEDLMTYDT